MRSRSETPTGAGRNVIEKSVGGVVGGSIINNEKDGNVGGGSSAKNISTSNLIKGSRVSDKDRNQRKPLESSNSVTSEKDTLLKETIKGI